jgi:tetratricopeptide (TPR) repeat protein
MIQAGLAMDASGLGTEDAIMKDQRLSLFARIRAYSSIACLAATVCGSPVLLAEAGDGPKDMVQLSTVGAQVGMPPATANAPTGTFGQLSAEELGDLHMARRRYQAALEAYRRAPLNSAEVWNKMGIAEQQLYLMPDAKKSYEMSIKLNPHNPDVLNNLGTVYYSTQQYGQAEKLYRRALKLKPKSALIYKNLGTNLLAANKFKKGWSCYQTALSIDPEIFERANLLRIGEPTPTQKRGAMSYYLAKSYVMVGMNDLAVEYLRRAIDEGFTDRKKILADKEFASLHDVSSFQQLLAEQGQRRQ